LDDQQGCGADRLTRRANQVHRDIIAKIMKPAPQVGRGLLLSTQAFLNAIAGLRQPHPTAFAARLDTSGKSPAS